MNPCLKTGADVLIETHQAILHGDLYVCGEMFVLRYIPEHDAARWIHEPRWIYDTIRISNPHASFFNNACDHADNEMPWAAPEVLHLEGAGVWVIHRDYVQLSDELKEMLAAQEAYRKYAIDKDDQFKD